MIRILIINGPNLNMLGKREPEIYGSETLDEINAKIKEYGNQLGCKVEFYQSNHEGEIIDKIHDAFGKIDIILINPAGFTHTSISIRDALLSVKIPVIEIHLSNIFKRESFRHHSFISDIAIGVISGFGIDSYLFAVQAAKNLLKK